jgi:acyl-CoA thioesterase-1
VDNSGTVRVFFFGDSICFGQGVSIHKGWVPRISASLSDLARDYDREVIVINTSVNGNTTRQALERMPYDIQSQSPDILITHFGMNDCNYWETDRGNPRVSPKAFAANLEEIITRAFSFGTKKVLINTNHLTGRDQQEMASSGITYQESNERYNQIIREVVASVRDSRVVLTDVEKEFASFVNKSREKLLSLLLPDLLHLSVKGHDLYFQTVYPAVERAVLDLIA